MLMTIFAGALIAVLAGLLIKYLLTYLGSISQITWLEFAIGAALCALIVVPSVSFVGAKMAKASKLSYREFWSGYETEAFTTENRCSKSYEYADCAHSYRCDPVFHTHTRTVSDGTDANGNPKTRTETYTETHWHYCPEVTHELDYYVSTTLGKYTIATNLVPPSPYEHEWDRDHNLPADVIRDAYVPAFWAAAKSRLEAGDPGPVTKTMPYDNYILASQKTILKQWSAEMEQYEKAGLLPKVAKKTYDHYYADKAYFVGRPLGNKRAWRDAVMRFNAALGTTLQGDLHFVIVNSPKVRDADEYFGALVAYWQSPAMGKQALSKNGILVAVSSRDGQTIDWARAATGMPMGNEQMIQALQTQLKGAPLEPKALFGQAKGRLVPDPDDKGEYDVKVTVGDGLLASIILTGPTQFDRVCMLCDDEDDDGVGFGYLGGEIQPSTGHKVAIFFVALFFCFAVWGALAALGVPSGMRSMNDRWRSNLN